MKIIPSDLISIFGTKESVNEVRERSHGAGIHLHTTSLTGFSISDLDFIEDEWKHNKEFPRTIYPQRYGDIIPSLREVLEQFKLFPEAKSYLEFQLKTAKKTLKPLVRKEEMMKYLSFKRYTDSHERELHFSLLKTFLKPQKIISEAIIKRNSLLLSKIDFQPNAELNIEKAKQYPITDLLEFKHRTAKCIFHNDKRPSLYYYPESNTCYCFSCAKYADSITVYMTLNNCDFKTAVKSLQ